jgi:hypothetical protein
VTASNGSLEVYEILRGLCDALDAVILSEVARTGSSESQTAERLARRVRVKLDQAALRALSEVA